MTETEKIELVKSLIDDAHINTEQISAYLSVAKSRIMDRLYPFGGEKEMPAKYEVLQCELVVRMIARRGGEGQIIHSENGVSRTWRDTDDADLLSRIVPVVGMVRGEAKC